LNFLLCILYSLFLFVHVSFLLSSMCCSFIFLFPVSPSFLCFYFFFCMFLSFSVHFILSSWTSGRLCSTEITFSKPLCIVIL
jgi:hypothetical protein